MRNITLFKDGEHKFILLNESDPGEEDGIRSNQYLILHGKSGVRADSASCRAFLPRCCAISGLQN
ncbi:MAG: hypothetical protein ACYCZR_02750 [Burkholderiales bacterium]